MDPKLGGYPKNSMLATKLGDLKHILEMLIQLTTQQLSHIDRNEAESLCHIIDEKLSVLDELSRTLDQLRAMGWQPGHGRETKIAAEHPDSVVCSELISRLSAIDRYVVREAMTRQQLLGERLSRLVAARSVSNTYSRRHIVGHRVDSST